MRVIRVDDDPAYGVALGSILVSLLEPAPDEEDLGQIVQAAELLDEAPLRG